MADKLHQNEVHHDIESHHHRGDLHRGLGILGSIKERGNGLIKTEEEEAQTIVE